MSRYLKDQIFYSLENLLDPEVYFYKVTRATTNTCEVVNMTKLIVGQDEKSQFVEPEKEVKGSPKIRCKILNSKKICMKNGKTADLWDGLPVKQGLRVFLLSF